MQTIEETRRLRLRMLVEKHNGMANLCERLGYARNETANLTRIMNGNVRHERGGKPYNMGSPMAREIEHKLNLETGWMDTPPTYAELHGGEPDAIDQAREILLAMESEARYQALRILQAMAKPNAHH